MSLAVIAPFWAIVIIALLLIAAAVQDATSMRISNMLSLAILLVGISVMIVHGLRWPMWQNGALVLLFLAVGTLIFGTGLLGGGDVKLLAAVGIWFRFADGLWLVVAVSISGGVLAIVMIVGRRVLASARGVPVKRGMIPYGVAIAAGALTVVGLQYQAKVALNDRLAAVPRLAAAPSQTSGPYTNSH